MASSYNPGDLTSYGHAIDKASSLDEARNIFIEMCSAFSFKGKSPQYIQEAKYFNKPKQRFTSWAWNVILSGEGLGVLKF